MLVIESKDNEQVKHIKKLKEKKYRIECNEFIVEGIKLVKEAILEKQTIKKIVICDGCNIEKEFDNMLLYEIAKLNCITVSEKIFKTLTEVEKPQGILAVIEKETNNSKIDYNEDFILILDNIQDPGNLGTILRTADSIGLKQIILSKGTVDAFSSKVVRATMGAIFRINIIESEQLEKTMQELKKHKFEIIATSLNTEKSIYDINFQNKTAIIIGNEANGVESNIIQKSDMLAKIPMLGRAESLNASVATGIIMYEYVRQKISSANL